MNAQAMVWLVRRELWENRALYLVPLVLAALVVFAAFYGLFFGMSGTARVEFVGAHLNVFTAGQLSALFGMTMAALAIPFNLALIAVLFFYLLDALYAERRNRSVLFFRSLPVTDTTSVLSKFLIAALVAPVITAAVILACAAVLWIVESLAFALADADAGMLGHLRSMVDGAIIIVYGLTVQSLWYAPVYAWLLLASSWARRAPFLWAVLPPALLIYLESLILGTGRLANLLGERLLGVFRLAFQEPQQAAAALSGGHADKIPNSVLWFASPGAVFSSPGLWLGLVAAGVFLTASVWLRRYRDDG